MRGIVTFTILLEQVRLSSVPEGAYFVQYADLAGRLVKGGRVGTMGNEWCSISPIHKRNERGEISVNVGSAEGGLVPPQANSLEGGTPIGVQ